MFALSVLGGLIRLFDLNCFVVEWLSNDASWTLHGNDTGLDSDSHICNNRIQLMSHSYLFPSALTIWYLNEVLLQDNSHVAYIFFY